MRPSVGKFGSVHTKPPQELVGGAPWAKVRLPSENVCKARDLTDDCELTPSGGLSTCSLRQ